MSRVNINNLEKSVDQYSLLLTDSTNTATYKNPATKTYNPLTDDVIFFSEGGSVLVDGNVMGWSNPEGVQWSNVPVWDNRSWKVSLNVETDGLGYFSSAITTQAFTSFFALIQHLNQILATYGSSFRLAAGASGDRILLTQINGTPIIDTADPYFVAGLFNNLELLIEDTITGGDYLVKTTNPTEFTVSNIYILGGKDLFKGKISSATSVNIRSVSTVTTLLSTDYTVVFTALGIIQPLPTSNNQILNLKNGSTGSISITGNIDGTAASTITVPAKNSLTFHGDGTTWWII